MSPKLPPQKLADAMLVSVMHSWPGWEDCGDRLEVHGGFIDDLCREILRALCQPDYRRLFPEPWPDLETMMESFHRLSSRGCCVDLWDSFSLVLRRDPIRDKFSRANGGLKLDREKLKALAARVAGEIARVDNARRALVALFGFWPGFSGDQETLFLPACRKEDLMAGLHLAGCTTDVGRLLLGPECFDSEDGQVRSCAIDSALYMLGKEGVIRGREDGIRVDGSLLRARMKRTYLPEPDQADAFARCAAAAIFQNMANAKTRRTAETG